MSDEPSALSTISQTTPPSESEYEAICAAVTETERGRWFLAEYARRNRNADTERILDAINRLESAIRGDGDQDPKLAESLLSGIAELAEVLSSARPDKTAISADAQQRDANGETRAETDSLVEANERTTSDILAAVEHIQEVAWAMREENVDAQLCDTLNAQAAAIFMACSLRDSNGRRAQKAIETLRYVETRINALIDRWKGADDEPQSEPMNAVAQSGDDLATAEFTSDNTQPSAVDAVAATESEAVAPPAEHEAAAFLELEPLVPTTRARDNDQHSWPSTVDGAAADRQEEATDCEPALVRTADTQESTTIERERARIAWLTAPADERPAGTFVFPAAEKQAQAPSISASGATPPDEPDQVPATSEGTSTPDQSLAESPPDFHALIVDWTSPLEVKAALEPKVMAHAAPPRCGTGAYEFDSELGPGSQERTPATIDRAARFEPGSTLADGPTNPAACTQSVAERTGASDIDAPMEAAASTPVPGAKTGSAVPEAAAEERPSQDPSETLAAVLLADAGRQVETSTIEARASAQQKTGDFERECEPKAVAESLSAAETLPTAMVAVSEPPLNSASESAAPPALLQIDPESTGDNSSWQPPTVAAAAGPEAPAARSKTESDAVAMEPEPTSAVSHEKSGSRTLPSPSADVAALSDLDVEFLFEPEPVCEQHASLADLPAREPKPVGVLRGSDPQLAGVEKVVENRSRTGEGKATLAEPESGSTAPAQPIIESERASPVTSNSAADRSGSAAPSAERESARPGPAQFSQGEAAPTVEFPPPMTTRKPAEAPPAVTATSEPALRAPAGTAASATGEQTAGRRIPSKPAPRSTPNDSLAAVLALTEEERIALFS